jgi:hypothetical protein
MSLVTSATLAVSLNLEEAKPYLWGGMSASSGERGDGWIKNLNENVNEYSCS